MQVVKPDFLAVSLGDFLVFFLGRIDFLRIFLMGFLVDFSGGLIFFADFSPHVQKVS